jgi:hypothetical protein
MVVLQLQQGTRSLLQLLLLLVFHRCCSALQLNPLLFLVLQELALLLLL